MKNFMSKINILIKLSTLLICCFTFPLQIWAEVADEPSTEPLSQLERIKLHDSKDSNTGHFSLEQAFEIAFTNNLGLKASRSDIEINKGTIRDAKRRINPNFISDAGIVAQDTYRAGIEKTFELGGKRKSRIALAQTRGKIVSANVNQSIVDLRFDVRKTYASLYYAVKRKEMYEELMETAKTTLELAKAKTEAGKTTILDSLQAQLAFSNLENIYRTIDYQVKSEKNKLVRILNEPLEDGVYEPPSQFMLEGVEEIDGDGIDDLIQAAFDKRPELEGVRYKKEESKRLLDLAKSNRIPNLSLAAGPDIVVPGGGENAFGAFVLAEFELPILYRQQGKIQEAKALAKKAEYSKKDLENKITMEVKNAYNAFKLSKELMDFYKSQVLVTAKDFVDKSQESYKFGKVSIIITLQAIQELKEISLNYLQASLDYQSAIADLEKAVGVGL